MPNSRVPFCLRFPKRVGPLQLKKSRVKPAVVVSLWRAECAAGRIGVYGGLLGAAKRIERVGGDTSIGMPACNTRRAVFAPSQNSFDTEGNMVTFAIDPRKMPSWPSTCKIAMSRSRRSPLHSQPEDFSGRVRRSPSARVEGRRAILRRYRHRQHYGARWSVQGMLRIKDIAFEESRLEPEGILRAG
jgi:hypothetical protein